MPSMRPLLLSIALIAGAACSASKPKEPEPTEIKAASARSVGTPQQVLLTTAKDHYAAGLFSLAKESFLGLSESYPTGPYAEFAKLKAADSSFEMSDYVESSKEYEQFVQSHPSSPSLDYALFRTARSAELSSGGIGRDASPLERSLGFYDQLITKFPESPFALAARKHKPEVLRLLAAHEHFVADYYIAQEAENAADARDLAGDSFLKKAEKVPPVRVFEELLSPISRRPPRV